MIDLPRKYVPFLIVGAGAAGLAAAALASQNACPCLVLDSAPEAGQKLLLTGGGRCNISNLNISAFKQEHYHGADKFLAPALRAFTPPDLIKLCAAHQLPLCCEQEGRLYPVAQKARAVRDFWLSLGKAPSTNWRFREEVLALEAVDSSYLLTSSKAQYYCEKLLIAAGAASFPQTGSTGKMLDILQTLGLASESFSPALCALKLANFLPRHCAGQSIQAVSVELRQRKQPQRRYEGDVLFTSQGISGTAVFNLARYFPAHEQAELDFYLQIYPTYSLAELKALLQNLWQNAGNKQLKNVAPPKLSALLWEELLKLWQIEADLKAKSISPRLLELIAANLQRLPLPYQSKNNLEQAYLCRGGVQLAEVNPRTMEAKRFSSLYLAGEILAYDGECGGYNLHAAFATGILAARAALSSLGYELNDLS